MDKKNQIVLASKKVDAISAKLKSSIQKKNVRLTKKYVDQIKCWETAEIGVLTADGPSSSPMNSDLRCILSSLQCLEWILTPFDPLNIL